VLVSRQVTADLIVGEWRHAMDVIMLCIGLAQIIVMIWQARIMMQPQQRVEESTKDIPIKSGFRYWPVIAMAVLAAFSWLPYIFHIGQPEIADFISAWGSMGDGCYQLLDGTKLTKYRDKYNIYVACGLGSPTIDQMQDPVIAISNAFTLSGAPIAIETKYNQAVNDAIRAMVNGVPPQPPSIWTQSFLLPKGVDISRVKKLADVREFGGKLIKNCQPIE
jgi:hypothetical protein